MFHAIQLNFLGVCGGGGWRGIKFWSPLQFTCISQTNYLHSKPGLGFCDPNNNLPHPPLHNYCCFIHHTKSRLTEAVKWGTDRLCCNSVRCCCWSKTTMQIWRVSEGGRCPRDLWGYKTSLKSPMLACTRGRFALCRMIYLVFQTPTPNSE